jgi:hypothetical protein
MIVFRGRDIGTYGAWENRSVQRISEFAGGGLKSTPSDIAQSHLLAGQLLPNSQTGTLGDTTNEVPNSRTKQM